MRKTFVLLVAAVVTLGLTVPALAQAPPAPAPKVTINGLVDFATSVYRNSTGDAVNGPGAARDITNDRDRGWYSRERGVFTLTGEIGRAKGVVALEIDFHNGRTTSAPAGFGGNSGFDIETDEKGQIEVKWLYLEAPMTGPDSLLPFLPMPTIGRFGGQPARGHDFKPGMHLSGDIPAVTLETMWAPNVRTTLTYVQMDEALDEITNAAPRRDNFAAVGSLEWDLFKGFTIKPLVSYAFYDGGSAGDGLFARGGFDPNSAAQAAAGSNTRKYTVGGDVRWTTGPFTLAPTFLYQFGKQEVAVAPGTEVDIQTFIADVIAGFRTGPLNIEVRGMYTPGMKATDCVQAIAGVCAGGSDIKYYEPITTGSTGFWAGWSEIFSSGVDYNVSMRPVSTGTQLGRSPSYDKYGRMVLGAALDYALTPALIFHVVTNVQWTAEKVDNNSTQIVGNGTSSASLQPVSGGDDQYLGNEWNVGFTYRFAPSVVFDLIGAYLFAGDAFDHGRTAASTTDRADAKDAYKIAARVRVTW